VVERYTYNTLISGKNQAKDTIIHLPHWNYRLNSVLRMGNTTIRRVVQTRGIFPLWVLNVKCRTLCPTFNIKAQTLDYQVSNYQNVAVKVEASISRSIGR